MGSPLVNLTQPEHPPLVEEIFPSLEPSGSASAYAHGGVLAVVLTPPADTQMKMEMVNYLLVLIHFDFDFEWELDADQ